MQNIKKAFFVFSIVVACGFANLSLAAKPDKLVTDTLCSIGRIKTLQHKLDTSRNGNSQVQITLNLDTRGFNSPSDTVTLSTGVNEGNLDVLTARTEMIDTLRAAMGSSLTARITHFGNSCNDLLFYQASIKVCRTTAC